MSVKTKISWLVKWLYKKFIRPVIFAIIDNPNSEIDEKVLGWLDKLFDYLRIARKDRKYIENGTFFITEIPKADEGGISSASLQTNDVIYNFKIYDAGVLISTFNNVTCYMSNTISIYL